MSDQSLKVDPHETLWITDAEMIRRMGVPEKIARQTIRMLDRNGSSGFPRKNPIWGGRRYWPAVKAFFDRQSNLRPQEIRKSA